MKCQKKDQINNSKVEVDELINYILSASSSEIICLLKDRSSNISNKSKWKNILNALGLNESLEYYHNENHREKLINAILNEFTQIQPDSSHYEEHQIIDEDGNHVSDEDHNDSNKYRISQIKVSK
jgi:hypothetical protein